MPTAMVTGPTAGIGRAFATAYARRGFDLVLVARDATRLSRVANDLSSAYGVGCEVLPADLADDDDLGRIEDRLAVAARPVDSLVNNAGFALAQGFGQTSLADEQRSLDVLVRAPLRLTHTALRQMLARGRGEIVNVSSVAGFLPRGTYGAHKAWLTSLSRSLHLAYRDRGIRVMALCPGFVRTEFHRRGGVDVGSVPGWMWLDADDLVRTAMRDLAAGEAVSVPTRRYATLALLARHAPSGLVARVSRRR